MSYFHYSVIVTVKPEITKPLKDVKAKEFETVELVCEVSQKDVKVKWLRNGHRIKESDRVKFITEDNSHTLVIKDCRPKDSAEFTCVIGNKKTTSQVDVEEAEADFIIKPTPLKTTEDEDAVFTCKLTKPVEEVQWFKDDKPIPADESKYEYTIKKNTHMLKVKKTTLEDAGTYTVKVKEKTSSAPLTVDEAPADFTIVLKDKTIKEKETVSLEVTVTKLTPVTWLKDGKPLPKDKRYSIVDDGVTHKLVIKHAKPEDSAVYTCIVGEKKTSAELTVEETDAEFTVPLKNKTAKENDDVTLEAVITKATPVKWLKNGKPIEPGTKYDIVEDGTKHTLKIRDAAPDDSAVYTLVVGSQKSSAELLVEEIEADFVVHLQDEEIDEEDKLILIVKLTKRPDDIIWLKNGEEIIEDDTHTIIIEENIHKLVISRTTIHDYGIYQVIVGSKQSTCEVVIKESKTTFVKTLKDVKVTESETATLDVVLSKDKPVKWFKNEVEIKPDQNNELVDEGPTKKLVIHNTKPEDTGKVTCKVQDEETTAKLTVVELPVKFVKPLENLTVTEKQTATFQCTVSKPLSPVTWHKNDKPITPSDRLKPTEEGPVKTLIINDAQPDDEATYTCISKTDKTIAKLTVVEAPAEFVKPLTDVTVTEKQMATFECTLSNPRKKVKWLRNKKELKPSETVEFISDGPVRRLVLKDCPVDDDQVPYTCVCKPASTTAKLFVQEETVKFVQEPEDCTVTEFYSTATFKCELTKDIPVTWQKEGKPIHPGKKYTVVHEGPVHELTINDVEGVDEGDYSVVTKDVKSTVKLFVKVLPRYTMDDKYLETVVIHKNSTLTIEIMFSGWPLPKPEWTLNDEPVSDRVRQDTNQERTIIRIPTVELQDAGTYSTVFKNPHGVSTATVDVVVADVPGRPSKPTVTDVTKETAVVTWKPPKEDEINPVTGYTVEKKQPDQKKWIKVNREPVKETSLKVPNLIEDNEYQFRVIAENVVGPSEPSEPSDLIKAKDPCSPPGPPSKPQTSEVTDTTVTVTWKPPKKDGGAPVTNYIVEHRPVKVSGWISSSSDTPVPKMPFKVENLQQGEEYIFRVTAENVAGPGEPSPSSDPVTVQKPVVKEPPSLDDLPEVTVLSGSPATFTTKVKGTPEPTVKWFRYDEEIFESKKHTVTYKQQTATLTIPAVYLNDAGDYTCVATNEVETKMTTAKLIVEAPPSLEYDDKWSKAKVKPGQDLKVPIKFTGFPKPTVKWTKNDKPLRPADRLTIDVKENFSILNIYHVTPDDTAVYKLTAENKHGKDVATCDITVLAPPAKPTGPLRVTDVQQTTITIEWKPPAHTGGSKITHYIVKYRKVTTVDQFTEVTDIQPTVTTCTIEHLIQDTEYIIQVLSVNKIGPGEPLESKPTRTLKAPEEPKATVPTPPRDLQVTDVTDSTAVVVWSKPENDGGSEITSYLIENREVTKKKWKKVTVVDGDILTCTVTKLTVKHDYLVRVFAQNAVGSSEPATLETPITLKPKQEKPSSPRPPLNVSDVTHESVRLQWKHPDYDSGIPLTSYYIEQRDTEEDVWVKVDEVEPSVTSYVAHNLQQTHEYQFRVFAANPEGLSPPITSESVRIPAEAKEEAEPLISSYTVHTLRTRDEYYFNVTVSIDPAED